MKTWLAIMMFLLSMKIAGQSNIDSLRTEATKTGNDSLKLKGFVALSEYYQYMIPDSTVYFSLQGLPIAQRLHRQKDEWQLFRIMGNALSARGNFAFALESEMKGLKVAENMNDPSSICWSNVGVGSVYFFSHDYRNALIFYKKVLTYPKIYRNNEMKFSAFIGEAYFHLGAIDSAFGYIRTSYELSLKNQFWPVPFYYMGKISAARNEFVKALGFYRYGISNSVDELPLIEGYDGMAGIFNKMSKSDSAIYYAGLALSLSQRYSFSDKTIESSQLLKDIYKSLGRVDSAFKYEEIMTNTKDSVYSQEKIRQLQSFAFTDQLNQQELLAAKSEYRNKVRLYALTTAVAIFILVAFVLWRNNRRKQKLNILLQKQKKQIENTLSELKSAQAQLIQSEKMASLGELTAGIAHEIQNPLNFVNNFSEVNKEMLDEATEEINKGNINEVKNILSDIKDNEEKINHHGKRADAIVKGMLQHSKQTKGIKEPTDINALCDEYLRLAYHGIRAKDKNFNADIKTDFDESIGKINIVPQDIGRVLLNLFNNAFYAVNKLPSPKGENYKPLVSVTTRKIKLANNNVAKNTPSGDGGIEIIVSDNGNGIHQNIVDKIFQPFFTTKPTGQGTGLGLSLAYDIITKEHNGTIKVQSKVDEGSVFVIQLPA